MLFLCKLTIIIFLPPEDAPTMMRILGQCRLPKSMRGLLAEKLDFVCFILIINAPEENVLLLINCWQFVSSPVSLSVFYGKAVNSKVIQ